LLSPPVSKSSLAQRSSLRRRLRTTSLGHQPVAFPIAEEDVGGDLIDAVASGIGHGFVHLGLDDLDGLGCPLLAGNRGAVQRRASGQDRLGTQRQRLDDVGAAADAASTSVLHIERMKLNDNGTELLVIEISRSGQAVAVA
jgi:hypothetical protein